MVLLALSYASAPNCISISLCLTHEERGHQPTDRTESSTGAGKEQRNPTTGVVAAALAAAGRSKPESHAGACQGANEYRVAGQPVPVLLRRGLCDCSVMRRRREPRTLSACRFS